jgi:hypothetical protein
MKKIDEVVALVVDHGRFVHVARCLGQQFAKVYYTSPEERDCPLVREASVGDGFDEIERVKSAWQVKDEVDLVVFPDIGFECMQAELRYQGIPVWGAGNASYLESNKSVFLDELSKTELPVAPHTVIKGLTNLRLHLMKEEDKYIKISKYRGDWETLHWTNFDEMEGTLDSYAVRFGCLKELITFYVFDAIETEIEDGVDAYCVGGHWPENVLHGMECKDKAYIGTIQKMQDLPEEVICVNDCFGPILDRLTNHGALKFSTEVRITEERESYFIDPTARFGSPPSQGECLLIKNLPEIIYRGALGELVEPEHEDNFVVQAFLSMCDDRDEWRSVKLTEEQDEAIKGGFCCKVDGKLCLMPITEYHTKEVGYLCATGKTMKQAIENLRKLKDDLPCSLHCEFASLADLLKEIHEAEAADMPFTDEIVPEPETIVADV